MPMWNDYLTILRDHLCTLIVAQSDIERIFDEAGLSRSHIDIGGKAVNTWHNALREAAIQRQDNKLLGVAYKVAPRLELAQAWLTYILNDVGFPTEVIQQLFFDSSHSRLEGRFEFKTVNDAADILWDFPDPANRRIYVIEYIERVTRQNVSLTVKTNLLGWIDHAIYCPELNVSSPDIVEMRQRLAQENAERTLHPSHSTYLMVEIIPDPFSRKGNTHRRFNLKVSYWQNEKTITRWDDPAKQESYRLEQIPQQVYNLLEENSHQQPTVIELFLPHELLTHEADQWRVAMKNVVDGQPTLLFKLSTKYKIVIRSLERSKAFNKGVQWQEWKEKWDAWHKERHRCAIRWFQRADNPTMQELFEELMNPEEKAACATFTFVPTIGAKDTARNGLMATILSAGVPIMLWSRKPLLADCDETMIRQELALLLQNENLDNLPEVVHKLRTHKDARTLPDHLGNHLAFFWDDPYRLPTPLNQNHSGLASAKT